MFGLGVWLSCVVACLHFVESSTLTCSQVVIFYMIQVFFLIEVGKAGAVVHAMSPGRLVLASSEGGSCSTANSGDRPIMKLLSSVPLDTMEQDRLQCQNKANLYHANNPEMYKPLRNSRPVL